MDITRISEHRSSRNGPSRPRAANGTGFSARQRREDQEEEARRRERGVASRLSLALQYHHAETAAHMARVGLTAARIAQHLGWTTDQVDELRIAGSLHDLGKIAVPQVILEKRGFLSEDEEEVMRRHPEIGADILGRPETAVLRTCRDVALGHHERWDGSGYPHGLSRAEIPPSARIVAVADVWDALIHIRPYRRALTEDEALGYLRSGRDQLFDPRIIDAFFAVLDDALDIQSALSDDDLTRPEIPGPEDGPPVFRLIRGAGA